MPDSDKQQEQDMERVKRAVCALGEYFDSVQIFTTRHAEDGLSTGHIEYGIGNNFAITGQIEMWRQQCIAAFRTEGLVELTEEDDAELV
jgi:hypothetical protein